MVDRRGENSTLVFMGHPERSLFILNRKKRGTRRLWTPLAEVKLSDGDFKVMGVLVSLGDQDKKNRCPLFTTHLMLFLERLHFGGHGHNLLIPSLDFEAELVQLMEGSGRWCCGW